MTYSCNYKPTYYAEHEGGLWQEWPQNVSIRKDVPLKDFCEASGIVALAFGPVKKRRCPVFDLKHGDFRPSVGDW